MEEITIMNIKIMQSIYLCLCTVLLLSSCTEHDTSAVPDAETGQLRFSVSPINASSRISYDNVHSQFDDNDAIGCIITVDGEYAVNSKWHYNESTGMLIFDGIWENITKDYQTQWSFIPYNDDENNKWIARDTGNGNESDGFIKLKSDGSYNFYFYYPYVDNDLLKGDIDNGKGEYQSLIYPNALSENYSTSNTDIIYTQYYLIGEAKSQGEKGNPWANPKTFASYTWTKYPCFVNHTQKTKEQINNSDFLWISWEGLKKESIQTINLFFKKKTATIEIDSDTPLKNVYLQAKASESLRRGKPIDLQTGELGDDYTYSTNPWDDASIQEKNVYFTDKEQLLPYAYEEEKKFRIVFPAQDAFPCDLYFTLNNTTSKVDLSTNISSLKEGYLYIIHITRAGETTLEIVDWENEHFEILHPEDAESSQS